MTEREQQFVTELSHALSHDVVLELMVGFYGSAIQENFALSDAMVAVRKSFWRTVGDHYPEYEIGQ